MLSLTRGRVVDFVVGRVGSGCPAGGRLWFWLGRFDSRLRRGVMKRVWERLAMFERSAL